MTQYIDYRTCQDYYCGNITEDKSLNYVITLKIQEAERGLNLLQ